MTTVKPEKKSRAHRIYEHTTHASTQSINKVLMNETYSVVDWVHRCPRKLFFEPCFSASFWGVLANRPGGRGTAGKNLYASFLCIHEENEKKEEKMTTSKECLQTLHNESLLFLILVPEFLPAVFGVWIIHPLYFTNIFHLLYYT